MRLPHSAPSSPGGRASTPVRYGRRMGARIATCRCGFNRSVPIEFMSSDAEVPELRALVVDDNVDAATSLSYLLQLLGCKTAVAFGGGMGLRVAQLFQPAIVFLDLDMPG